MCGAFRPGHFRGVATVVCKLFNMVQPDVALFGQKDFQQCAVVRRMAGDLNLPIEIITVPTVREPDGLAMSSRNPYLDAEERRRALAISRGLLAAADEFRSGERDVDRLIAISKRHLATVDRLQYRELVDAHTLKPATSPLLQQCRCLRRLNPAHRQRDTFVAGIAARFKRQSAFTNVEVYSERGVFVDERFLKDRARIIRDLADKPDPFFIKKWLLELALRGPCGLRAHRLAPCGFSHTGLASVMRSAMATSAIFLRSADRGRKYRPVQNVDALKHRKNRLTRGI
nr:pantoate--beta-alanine ligase [Bradyrhizobium zhanjiangense]